VNAAPRRSPDPWWRYAQDCATALNQGIEPPVIPTHGPLLKANEVTRLSAPAYYSRLASGDGNYDRANAPFFVNPILMGGAMATQGAINRRRRRHADRDAHPTWRNHREVAVLTTNLRLMCSRPDGGYVSFWYQDLTEFYPDPDTRTLTMAFDEDHTAPLRLNGPAVPGISLWAAHALYGPAWREHPKLAALIPTDQTHSQSHPDRTQGPADTDLTDEQRRWWAQHQHRAHNVRSTDGPDLNL